MHLNDRQHYTGAFFDTKSAAPLDRRCAVKKDALPSVGHSALVRLSAIVLIGAVMVKLCQNNDEYQAPTKFMSGSHRNYLSNMG